MYVCDNFVIGFFSISSTMLSVAAEAAEVEEAVDIVMSVCYTMYIRMSLSCFRFMIVKHFL